MELVNSEPSRPANGKRAQRRAKCAGAFAIAFGFVGVATPTLFLGLRETGASFPGVPQHQPSALPCVFAILAHLYLILARLVRGKSVQTLPYFFAAESAYGLLAALVVPTLSAAAVLSPVEARWVMDVSLGFSLQLATGFPLWGWMLTRTRTGE